MDKCEVPVPEVFSCMIAMLGKHRSEVSAICHEMSKDNLSQKPFVMYGKCDYYYVSGCLIGCVFDGKGFCESVIHGVSNPKELFHIVIHILLNLRCRLADYVLLPELGKLSIWECGEPLPLRVHITETVSANGYATIQVCVPDGLFGK